MPHRLMARVGLCFLATAAAFQPPVTLVAPRASSPHRRAPDPAAGFFDEMRKGFDAGKSPPSSPPTEKKKSQNKFLEALTFVDDGDTVQRISGPPSFFQAVKAIVSPASLTIEERVAAGEGVVWSADFSRAWKASNGFPSYELSVAEAKELLEELSLPIPAEVGGDSA